MNLSFSKHLLLTAFLGLLLYGAILLGCAAPPKKEPPPPTTSVSTLPTPAPVRKTVKRSSIPRLSTKLAASPTPSPTPTLVALVPVHHGPRSKMLDQQALLLASFTEIQRTREGIVVILKSDDLFEKRDEALKSNSISQLERIGDILAAYPADRLIVAGHTDNQGTDEAAKLLTESQAMAVRNQLLTRHIPEKHITSVGMGKSEPIASNGTVEGQAQNRRLEIRITCK